MLNNFFKTATWKQSQITIAGTLVNGTLGALFYVFIARFLGPSDFGILTIALTTLVLIGDIADIGTNTGLVKFVPVSLKENTEKAYRYLKLSLEIKLIAWLVSFLLIFFLAPLLAESIFHKAELVLPLRLSALGVGGALLFTFATSTLQAYQKYFTWSVVNILTNFFRLFLIFILGYFVMLNLESSLLIYIVMPFFGFFVSLFILPTRKIFQSKNEFNLVAELFRYNIPVALFTLVAAFSSRLDTYLNAVLLSSKEVGIYGAASQIVVFMPQLVSALGLVSSPKFASFGDNKQMLTYFKKFQLFVSGLVVLGILSIPVFTYLIPILFGPEYKEAVTPFIILFLGQLIFLFSIPVHHSVIFYFGRPDIFIWVALGHLSIIAGLGYFMILHFGMTGAAITVLVGMIFNFLYPLSWMLWRLKKKK